MPVFNTPLKILEEAIISVINPTNNSWKLIICIDNSANNNVEDFILHLNEWIILRGKDLEPKSKNVKVIKWSDVAKRLLIHIKKN